MRWWFRFGGLTLCLLGLVAIRKFETVLFYDPFLKYFHGPLDRVHFPAYKMVPVLLHIVFRYTLNSLLSIGILQLVFVKQKLIHFSVIVYAVFLFLLLPSYAFLVHHHFEVGGNLGFYVRRLLIQPVLLMVLLPALYVYQNKAEN
ncbi:MAG: exosortase F system-associated protein [Bacteroidetes bacterium]|nr:exosortase F system-associated protein [Bacteroidota bacterium]MBS1739047.1 exosortase F system-associated protein [Bacteroidota bacterium]